jgi:hypothetical protein
MTKRADATDPKGPATADDLRDLMSENVRRLQSGEITPAEANAATKRADAVLRQKKAALRDGKVEEVEGFFEAKDTPPVTG